MEGSTSSHAARYSEKLDITYCVPLKKVLEDIIPSELNAQENYLDYLRVINEVQIVGQVDFNRTVPASFQPRSPYISFLQDLIQWLHTQKKENVLTFGYKRTDSGFNNVYTSFQVKYLLSNGCHQVYELIGQRAFFNLIVQGHGLVVASEGLTQVFGPYQSTWSANLKAFGRHLPCLHYWTSITVRDNLELFRGMTPQKLTEKIFELENQNIPRSLRSFRRIASKILQNDKKIAYGSIVLQLAVTPSKAETGNFSLAFVKPNLIRCIIVIIDKLFPMEVWGCTENRFAVFDRIREIIELNIPHVWANGKLNIKITCNLWLGKSRKITSRQDYDSRQRLMTLFLTWVLNFVLPLIVRSFWHVTEVSHSNELLYFPHHKWIKMTSAWVKQYIDNNLVPVLKSELQVPTKMKFVYGFFRLLPKANDFRLICIPVKNGDIPGRDTHSISKSSIEYQMHYTSCIVPVLKILAYRSNMHFNHQRCHSLIDVAKNVRSFAAQYPFSQYYFVKFDMKQCYDRIDQTKIVECVDKIFGNDNASSVYYVRQYTQLGKNLKVRRTYFNVYEDLVSILRSSGNIEKEKHFKHVTIDRCKTYKITKGELMDMVSSQVFESVCYVPHLNSYFRRKQGIFQGFPLLATLCDIVYCSMMEDRFGFALADPGSSLLRIADDFLLVTTSPSIYDQCLQLISGQALKDYGAVANLEKTVKLLPTDHCTEIQFVGLSIDTKTLQITVDHGTPISLTGVLNFKRASKLLCTRFKSRLSSFYLNQTLVSEESVISYLDDLLQFVTLPILNDHRQFGNSLTSASFQDFILELLRETLNALDAANFGCFQQVDEIIELFKRAIIPLNSCVNTSSLLSIINSL